jgi:dihydrofolate reductase
MRKLVSFMHVSLDGFVAGPNGEMDWIKVDEEIFDYAGHRTSVADTALYGRATHEIMEAYWPTAADKPGASKHDIEHSTWYKKVEKIVLSRSMKSKKLPGTKIISENISKEINKLKQTPGTEIIMFGSPSATNFLIQEGLVDEFWIFVNPILLGQGIPFFNNLKQRTKLKLVKSRAFSSGVVCLHYEKI